MRYLVLPAFFLFLFVRVSSQITFEKAYGGPADDVGECAREVPGSGYILCGRTVNSSAGSYDALIIRTDQNGDTIWTKTLGGSGYDGAWWIEPLTGGGFICCGGYSHPGANLTDVYLIRMNESGDTVWTKNHFSGFEAVGYMVRQLPGDGFIIAGNREDAAGTVNMFLIRTDESGDTIWTKIYGKGEGAGANSVWLTRDSGFLLCGYADSYFPSWNRNIYLVKSAANGDTLWTNTYGSSAYEMGWAAVESHTDGYLVAGYTTGFGAGEGDLYLMKAGHDGLFSWEKHYGKTGLDIGYDIGTTSDENYILTGISAWYGEELQTVYLLKITDEGDTLWTSDIGDYPRNYGYSVEETEDNGYVICGNTNALGAGEYDVLLVKTDENGGIITGSSESYAKEKSLRIWPNPCKGSFRIKTAEPISAMDLTDLSGRVVYHDPAVLFSASCTYSFTVKNMTPGIYLVRLAGKDRILFARLIFL
jgi:hypothetical protein